MDSGSPDLKSNGPKSPTRNGDPKRPAVDRTDTGQWATDNDSDDQVQHTVQPISMAHVTLR